MKQTKTSLTSGYHVLLWKEGSWYVAKCVEIEVASQGKTKNDALHNIEEAISLLLEEKPSPRVPVMNEIELHTVSSVYA